LTDNYLRKFCSGRYKENSFEKNEYYPYKVVECKLQKVQFQNIVEL